MGRGGGRVGGCRAASAWARSEGRGLLQLLTRAAGRAQGLVPRTYSQLLPRQTPDKTSSITSAALD